MTDTTIVNEEPVIEVPETTEEVTEVELPGAKTESVLLLESLQEERRKRKELEAELEATKSTGTYTDADEVNRQVAEIKARLDATIEASHLAELQAKYPALKDKVTEFNEYRDDPENTGMNLGAAAKAFLAERDLLVTPARKGLETGTTARQPVKTGRTEQEIAELRTTNYRQYMKELKAKTLWS